MIFYDVAAAKQNNVYIFENIHENWFISILDI